MPVVLLVALAASLGLHAALLFGPQIDLATESEPQAILAELRPMPRPAPPHEAEKAPVKARTKARGATAAKSRLIESHTTAGEPVANLLPPAGEVGPAADGVVTSEPTAAPTEPAMPRIPERGRVMYRVDRGDDHFEIGFARHTWHIADGAYQIDSLLETTGLVWLFKSIRIEMQSRGHLTVDGFRPDTFVVRRNGAVRERAAFDWQAMSVRVGDRAAEALHAGAQDLLSFHYQLGYLPQIQQGSTVPVATGKKYGAYRLEVVGDEEIELPVGHLRTLHLRAPGVNTTELWLAYDYLMLPVKIRHLDSQGDSLVQVATEIQMSPE